MAQEPEGFWWGLKVSLLIIVPFGLIGLYLRWKDAQPAKQSAAAPAQFDNVPELQSPENTPITEAAYHQQPVTYAPATGPAIGAEGSEVLTLT